MPASPWGVGGRKLWGGNGRQGAVSAGIREGVMVRTLTTVVVVGLSMTVCGCAGSAWQRNAAAAQGQPARASGPCLEQDGFAVLYFRAIQNDSGVVSVIGEVKNVGMASRGVELQAALRDADGRVIAVGNFCPASYKNIAPGETWPFSYSFGRQDGIVRAEMRIIGAFRALDVLDPTSIRDLQ